MDSCSGERLVKDEASLETRRRGGWGASRKHEAPERIREESGSENKEGNDGHMFDETGGVGGEGGCGGGRGV